MRAEPWEHCRGWVTVLHPGGELPSSPLLLGRAPQLSGLRGTAGKQE